MLVGKGRNGGCLDLDSGHPLSVFDSIGIKISPILGGFRAKFLCRLMRIGDENPLYMGRRT